MVNKLPYFLGALLLAACGSNPPAPPPVPPPIPPNFTLSSSFGAKRLEVNANPIFGNAIFDATVNGIPVIDHTDHGRELQVAWQLNGKGEGENPTEAGSGADANKPSSSTHILSASQNSNVLTTSVNPAYWLPFNGAITSPHTFNKTVTIQDNVLTFENEIILASDQSLMGIEGITAYMPRGFTRFFLFDDDGNRTELPASSPLANYPNGSVAAATVDGGLSVGCHGLISGVAAGVIDVWPKIDCSLMGIGSPRAGSYPWSVSVVFGSLDEVSATLKQILGQRRPMMTMGPMVSCAVYDCRLQLKK